ncbi:hypothetical protein Tco_1149689, partial [Tanacetum coccineum]
SERSQSSELQSGLQRKMKESTNDVTERESDGISLRITDNGKVREMWNPYGGRWSRSMCGGCGEGQTRAKFVLGGISNIRTLTPSLNGSTGWPLYVFS